MIVFYICILYFYFQVDHTQTFEYTNYITLNTPNTEQEFYRMKIAILKIKLYAPWVHSLKEKRMVVKSLLAKIRNKFHVSEAEVEDQDVHQSIIIGIASIVPHSAQADAMMDEIVHFIEQSTEAEIVEEEREIR